MKVETKDVFEVYSLLYTVDGDDIVNETDVDFTG